MQMRRQTMTQHSNTMLNQFCHTHALCSLSILFSVVALSGVHLGAFSSAKYDFNTVKGNSSLIAKSRYSAGLVCKDRGWEFCATWANIKRIPGSRIA